MVSAKKRKRKWNNNDLMKEFLRLDKKYFDGELPMPLHLAFTPINSLGYTFRYRTPGKRRSKEDRFGIHISTKLRFSRRLWASTLIHEMVHLEDSLKHSCGKTGRYFNKRMRELAAMRAFDGIW